MADVAGAAEAAIAAKSALQWLELLGLGGALGALGQGARAIVGFKKLHDSASASSPSTSDLIDAGRLLVSLGIGFVAGALAAVPLVDNLAHVSGQQIFALVAAGYAGADFVEGFMRRIPGSEAGGSGDAAANSATDSDGAAG